MASIPFVSLPLQGIIAIIFCCASFSRSLEGIKAFLIPSRDTSHYLFCVPSFAKEGTQMGISYPFKG